MARHKAKPSERAGESRTSRDPFIRGEELLERAKRLATRIEERIRELTSETRFSTDPGENTLPSDSAP